MAILVWSSLFMAWNIAGPREICIHVLARTVFYRCFEFGYKDFFSLYLFIWLMTTQCLWCRWNAVNQHARWLTYQILWPAITVSVKPLTSSMICILQLGTWIWSARIIRVISASCLFTNSLGYGFHLGRGNTFWSFDVTVILRSSKQCTCFMSNRFHVPVCLLTAGKVPDFPSFGIQYAAKIILSGMSSNITCSLFFFGFSSSIILWAIDSSYGFHC